jgi:hypothetical protein
MNDVIVWLSYENLRITTSIQGYSSGSTFFFGFILSCEAGH